MSAPSTIEQRRLPGVSFETARTSASGGLPRMDVTAFAGLAAAGPFDVPVRIEDPLRFREIFGPDLELTTAVTGVTAHRSLLGPTVDAYFANGGRVCWIVRVGARDEAVTSRFRVPGLVEWHAAGPRAAWVAARSPGSAFDRLRVGGTLQRRELVRDPSGDTVLAESGSIRVSAVLGVRTGQLLELRWGDGTYLWVPIEQVAPGEFGRLEVRWVGASHWFRRSASGTRPPSAAHALSTTTGSIPLADSRHVVDDGGSSTLTTTTPLDTSVVGDVVVRSTAGATVELFVVDDVSVDASTDTTTLRSLATWQQLTPAAVPPAAPLAGAAIVTVGLVAFDDDTFIGERGELDATSAGARWWGHLPSDDECFGREYRRAATGGEHPHPGPLDEEVMRPRFALAASDAPSLVLPLGLRDDPLTATRSAPLAPVASASTRDGVGDLTTSWFLDPFLASEGVHTLDRTARRRFFVDDQPLRGIHAVIPLDEVAVLSVPDAVQSGWSVRTLVPPGPIEAPLLGTGPDPDDGSTLSWTVAAAEPEDRYEVEGSVTAGFDGTTDRVVVDATTTRPDVPGCEPRWYRVRVRRGSRRSGWSNSRLRSPLGGSFLPCDEAVRGVPVLEHLGAGVLRWQLVDLVDGSAIVPPPDTAFEIDVAPDPEFASADRQVVRGPDDPPAGPPGSTTASVTPDPTRHTWYRVRVRPDVATPGELPGPWSRTVVIAAAPREIRVADETAGSIVPTAVEVHQAMAALTAARSDLTALVSFPSEYRHAEIAEHLSLVRSGGDIGSDGRNWVDLLHAHHPWIASVRGDEPVWSPPDGPVAGRLAAGALARGAWIATAGRRLERVVDVRRRLDVEDVLALRDHRVNSLVVDRADIVVVGNDTLADDRLVAPVTVRRLLIVLRRLVRREGDVVVFENNGPVLWSIVRVRFERLLGEMFRLGAFAGSTPAEAFRVICDRGLNPPANLDDGRLVVELQVAPSHPLEFLRIRFVQTDAAGPDVLEVR